MSVNNTHRVMISPDGKKTTVALGREDSLLKHGYTIGEATRGGAKWNIEESTPGSKWVDNGYNNGFVKMTNDSGRVTSVNARYADKYFDQGYSLHDTSQSINRALQSEYHATNDRMNEAIRNGNYNPNYDYSAGSVAGGRYEYSDKYAYNGGSNSYLDSVNRALGNIGGSNQGGAIQDYSALEGLLQKLVGDKNSEALNSLMQEFNQYKSSYSDNPNNYVANNQEHGSSGYDTSYGSRGLGQNVLPGQIFIGNSGKKVIRENGVDREMNDDEVVQYLDSIYGF